MTFPRHWISPLLVIAAVSFLAITPFFWQGNPSGHDFEFHVFSWMEVHHQWKQGIVYPRWAELAHWGYGEARFLFYPPASWTLGAALGTVLPWKMVPGAYVWIALTLAGASMFSLARRWLPARDAIFAAALYAVNPYHLVIVYWRSAYAELLAATLLPFLGLCVLRIGERDARPVLQLSLVLAAAWLTNAPSAVMIHYSVAVLAVVVAATQRSWRPLPGAGFAIVLGAGLASFYLIPAVYEESWVNIAEVLAPGVRPQDNFLFTAIADLDHNRFNLFVSSVAIVEIIAVVAATWFARGWWTKRIGTSPGCTEAASRAETRSRNLWILLSVWAAIAALVMLPMTNLLWEHLPKLRFVQLPWRWLLCLNAAMAILLTMATRRLTSRVLVVGALVAVVIIGGYRIQQPWWDTSADIQEMNDAISDATGYEGTDEYVPVGADPYELNKDLPKVAVAYQENQPAKVLEWGPVDKHFAVQTDVVELLPLRLFNYPAWEVTVNGERVPTRTAEVTGQMQILLTPGANDVRIHFGRTRDRTIGGMASVISVGVFVAVWIWTQPKKLVTQQM